MAKSNGRRHELRPKRVSIRPRMYARYGGHAIMAVITCIFQGFLLRMRQVVLFDSNALLFLGTVPMGSVINEKK